MTAIKPIENRRVVSVPAETYPLNAVCAHPECKEPTADPHHAFPRSTIGGDSWFVVITFDSYEDAVAVLGKDASVIETGGLGWVSAPLPHTTGLCRTHHEEAEEHVAWVKLEGGVWKWLVRDEGLDQCPFCVGDECGSPDKHDPSWIELGELNPQPGSRDGKAKRKRFQGEARRTRKVISIRVPDDAGEDGAALLDEGVECLEELIQGEGKDHRPIYYTIMAALGYTLLNADETDFE